MLAASLALISTTACAKGPVTAVTVRDAHFEVVKELTSAELPEFNQQWRRKMEVEVHLKEVGGKHFKLDLSQESSGGRWLYYTTGFVSLLGYNRQPVYKVSKPKQFNKLIGAEK